MKRILYLFLLFIVVNSTNLFAKKIPALLDYKALDSLSPINYVSRGSDLFESNGSIFTDTTWRDLYCYNEATGRIVLRIKDNLPLCPPSNFSVSVSLRITTMNSRFVVQTFDTTLMVSYNRTKGLNYLERAIYVKSNVHYIKAQVLNINPSANSKYLCLEAIIEEDRNYCGFTKTMVPQLTGITYQASEAKINLTFHQDLVDKCDFIEIEYTFVDAYSYKTLAESLNPNFIWFDFRRNSNRVAITSNTYSISNIFEKGYLIFRARGVVMKGPLKDKAYNGNWSLDDNGNLSGVSSNWYTGIGVGGLIPVHQENINWQLQADFAEEAKSKEVVTYYDGLLKKRQTVTRNSSDNMAIVADEIYDHLGRQAISVLPVPAFENRIRYFEGFAKNNAGEPYNIKNFDLLDQGSDCVKQNGDDPMSTLSGAAKYYSANNPLLSMSNLNARLAQSIPNASGYPFAHTEYMPDQTGRIRRQSGPGATHKMGNGHETKYYYGVPTQLELDKLFGTEVGVSSHYKKNMVIDANGQASISYLDSKGRVIATCLAGESPAALQSLSSNTGYDTISMDLQSYQDTLILEEGIVLNTAFHVSKNNTAYSLKYFLNPQSYFPICASSQVCYNCMYDLEITLTGEDCNTEVFKLKRKIGGNVADTICQGQLKYSFADDAELNVQDSLLTVFLNQGAYTLTKKLTIDEEAYEFYFNDFKTNRICKTESDFLKQAYIDIDTNQCNLTCEQCNLQLGPKAAFLQKGIQNILASEDSIPNHEDTVAINSTYDKLKLNCDGLCPPAMTGCDAILNILMEDMKPGGQYALIDYDSANNIYVIPAYNSTTKPKFNILEPIAGNGFDTTLKNHPYFAANGLTLNGTYKTFKDFTLDELVMYWQDTFSAILVKQHPEYCKYLKCIENNIFDAFETDFRETDTYEKAVQKGYFTPLNPVVTNPLFQPNPNSSLDPFFTEGKAGNILLTNARSRVSNFLSYTTSYGTKVLGMKDMAVWQLYCSDLTNNDDVLNCVEQHKDSIFICGANRDYYWRNFRGIYLALRQKIADSLTSVSTYKGLACSDSRVPTSYEIRLPQGPASLIGNNDPNTPAGIAAIENQVNDSINLEKENTCEGYIPIWWQELAGCNLSPADSTYIIGEFLAICNATSTLKNTFGNSSLAPNQVSPISLGFRSFDDVLSGKVNGTGTPLRTNFRVKGICDGVLISMPKPYGHDYLAYDNPAADTCACKPELYNYPVWNNPSCEDTVFTPDPNCTDCPSTGGTYANEMMKQIIKNSASVETQYKCKNCIDCTKFAGALQKYKEQYGPQIPASVPNQTNQTNSNTPAPAVDIEKVFTQFLNNTLGFNLSFDDYIKFGAECLDTLDTYDAVMAKFDSSNFSGGETVSTPSGSIHVEEWDRNVNIDTCGCNIILKAERDWVNGFIDTTKFASSRDYVEKMFNCGNPLLDYNKHRDACFTAANGLYIDSTLVPYYSVDTIANSTSVNINWANSFWGLGNNGQPRVIKTAAIAGQEGAFIDGYILVGDSLIPYYARWQTIPALSLTYILHENGSGSWRDNLKSLNSCLPPKCCKKLCNRPFYELKLVQEDPCKLSLKAIAKRMAAQRYTAYLDSSLATFRKAYLAKCLRPLQIERIQEQLQVFQYHYTLYYYDQAGNLTKTIPPAGVKPFGNEDARLVQNFRLMSSAQRFTPNHLMATTYQYNSLNALCWQKTPDAGESKFYYDDLGRLVVSQNAKQIAIAGAVKQYSYTLFDPLGRIVEVGQINQANPMTDLMARTPASLNAWLATTFKTQITRTKYDEADYSLLDTTLFNPKNLRNRVVYSSYAAGNGNFYEHAVHYSYDAHGNVKTLLREIKGLVPLLNDYKLVHYKYDLVSGKVNEVAYQTGMADQYLHKYNYDAENRLISVETGPGKYQLDEDAKYRYYLHGPLARMELGKLQVQGVDYAYTLQGWLKGVNSSHLQTQRDLGRDGYKGTNGFAGNAYFPADAYGFTLGYYEGDYQMIGNMAQSESFVSATAGSSAGNQSPNLYNGNIRMMSVAIRQFGVYPLLNSYRYDQLNRLVSSTSYNQFDSVANAYPNNATALPQYLNTFSYDANGNILKQLRNGGPSQVAMDSLHYEYEMVAGLPTNKLRRVTDAVAAANYADDIDKQVDFSNYTYDAIGNLIQDKAEQILSIEWNVYGKIQKIIRTAGSTKPDLEFEYSPDGHRVVKIVKPKNGNQNLYTYYVRDAQGNVLATYERSFAKILDFQNITYAKINDTLVKYTGLSGLAEFSAQYSNLETVRNAYMNQLGSNFEFLYTFSPYQFLKDDQNNLDTLLNRIELGEFLNLLFTASPPDFETVCRCLKNRHQMNSNYAPLMRAFVVDSASLMNLFLAMEMTNYGDLIPALAARLGFENLNIEDAKEELNRYVYGNNGNGSNLKILFDELYKIDEGFRDCGPSVSNFLFKLHTDQPNKLIELLTVIPDLRDMFYRTASSDGFDCSYSFSHDDMASLMSNNYSELSWNKLIDAFGTNTLLTYFVNNQNSYFMNQAVLYNKTILTNTQQNQNLYGGNYGGLENYFAYIRNYFGQGLYDQITAGFMQQSSVYTDSLRLEEWHLYGSSRIGIYQTNKAMAQRTVRIENGVTTQISNTHIEQLSLSRFYTERGAKRYELSNHLGNVLTVVTDKKLPVCSSNNISYFIADVVSATDYSPFGAPLAGRTYQGNEYRYGFNGKEKDDETYGGGNAYDFGARIFNARLGRWLSVDPFYNFFVYETPYLFAGGNPIKIIDPNGKEKIVVSGQPGPHKDKTHFLDNGLDRAVNLKKDAGSEQVTWIIYMGNDPQGNSFTLDQIKPYLEKATEAGIKIVLANANSEIVNYVNYKFGGQTRDKDLISNFTYVGHAHTNDLATNYTGPGSPIGLDVGDFQKGAFSDNSTANLENGCNTANPKFSGNQAMQMSLLIGDYVTGATSFTNYYKKGVIAPKDLQSKDPKHPGEIKKYLGTGGASYQTNSEMENRDQNRPIETDVCYFVN